MNIVKAEPWENKEGAELIFEAMFSFGENFWWYKKVKLFQRVILRAFKNLFSSKENIFSYQYSFFIKDPEIIGLAIFYPTCYHKKLIKSTPFLSLFHKIECSEDALYLHILAIKKEYRGKGYGRKFLEFIKEYALENNFKYIVLHVVKSNKPAKALYLNMGFCIDKEIKIPFNLIPSVEGVEELRLKIEK